MPKDAPPKKSRMQASRLFAKSLAHISTGFADGDLAGDLFLEHPDQVVSDRGVVYSSDPSHNHCDKKKKNRNDNGITRAENAPGYTVYRYQT